MMALLAQLGVSAVVGICWGREGSFWAAVITFVVISTLRYVAGEFRKPAR